MENKLQYRENNYFNLEDLYVFDNNLDKLLISKVHLYNGNWFSDVSCQYKMTSVRCINCKELYGLSVEHCGVKGTVSKFLGGRFNDLGVQWVSGEQIKKNGIPNFWNEINNLKFM